MLSSLKKAVIEQANKRICELTKDWGEYEWKWATIEVVKSEPECVSGENSVSIKYRIDVKRGDDLKMQRSISEIKEIKQWLGLEK